MNDGKMHKNGKLLKNKNSKRLITRVLLIGVKIISTILFLVIISCLIYGIWAVITLSKLAIDTKANISSFNKNIAPQVVSQITDSRIRFSLDNFEEIMMPQFYIDYIPDLEIRFHTVIGSGKNELKDKNPLLGVSIKNIKTKKTCSFDFRNQNYDFLQENPDYVSNKLLDLYYNRQIIIDDFRTKRPECFL